MSIHAKLGAIQSKLKAPKSQFNSFGKYNYRNCEDILEAVKPLLLEFECILTLSDNIQEISGRFYVCATAAIYDVEQEGNCQVTAYAREEEAKSGMAAAQITGSASSYARKYALNGLFLIDDTKDDDYTSSESKAQNKATATPKITKVPERTSEMRPKEIEESSGKLKQLEAFNTLQKKMEKFEHVDKEKVTAYFKGTQFEERVKNLLKNYIK